MLKNVAGQSVGSQVLNQTTGAAFDGSVTVYVTGDGGVQTLGAIASGVCVAEGNGYFSYSPTQAETNYNHVAFTFVGAGAIPATVTVATITEAQAAAIVSATISTVIGDGPTRIELLNQLAHRLNKTPPPNMDSSTSARLIGFLNQRQRRLLTMPGLRRLRDATVTFSSVSEQGDVGLPNLAKIQTIFEHTNDRVLYEMSQQELRLVDPNPMSGTPEAYVWRGRQVVQQQPSVPSPLYVQSSHAADVRVVFLEGVADNRYAQMTSVALMGTTPVLADGIWTRVDKCYLSAPANGAVTLSADSGAGPILAVIPVGKTTSIYTGITLWPTPSAPITYFADVTRTLSDLLHDTDQTPIPDDFADILVLGALADEYQHLSDPRWSAAMTEYKERERQLQYWLAETHIGRPFSLTRGWQKGSQLGSWFPAGT